MHLLVNYDEELKGKCLWFSFFSFLNEYDDFSYEQSLNSF
ncbi:hypothetical protein CP10881SC42_0821 [Chlamydia avium]|uniref:Uncharacterized protein n=1 Tax=Chlamydia avium TaxID=1457141 RepID=A0ABN0MRV1_9CHLA|nr:hypothetical protein CP10743SC13_0740 [Chlamydia psittaci 10_743_SC13]EPP38187.1 hypothetical protein CP10881SC42_0821 [Chlamydia avium]